MKFEEFIEAWETDGIGEAVGIIKENIKDEEVLDMIDFLENKFDEMDTKLFKYAFMLGDYKRRIETLEKYCNELLDGIEAYKSEFLQ